MAKHKSVFSLKNIILLFGIVMRAGVGIAQFINKKGDVVPKRVGLAPLALGGGGGGGGGGGICFDGACFNATNGCTFLSQTVKDEVWRLEHLLQNSSEFNISFVEYQWMNKNDYFLTRTGLFKVYSIVNQTTGFSDDRVRFADALDFGGSVYETSITSEGFGTVFLKGQSCTVEYRGANSISEDSREVRVNCLPLDTVDTFFCDFKPKAPDACLFLNQTVKDKVFELERSSQNSSDWNITFVENQWMNRNDYFLTRYGEQLYRVNSIINRTVGFFEDRIIFRGVFSGNTYETTILREGSGMVFIGGQCYVEYRGANSLPEEMREVRLNCLPLDTVDTFFCDFKPKASCTDSDGGFVLNLKGTVVTPTANGTDLCLYNSTTRNYNMIREYYCNN